MSSGPGWSSLPIPSAQEQRPHLCCSKGRSWGLAVATLAKVFRPGTWWFGAILHHVQSVGSSGLMAHSSGGAQALGSNSSGVYRP